MKTAIILNGNIRTWNLTGPSFIETFGGLAPDIFIETYDLQYGYHPHIQGVINDNADRVLSDIVIRSMLDNIAPNIKHLKISSHLGVLQFLDSERSKLDVNFRLIDNCFCQYYKYYNAMNAVVRHEQESGFQYDMIIKTRFDMMYNPIDYTPVQDNIIVDSGNVFPNDCIVVGTRNRMVEMANFMYFEFYHPTNPNSHTQPPHGLLKAAIDWVGCGINTQKIMDHVVRKNGKKQYY